MTSYQFCSKCGSKVGHQDRYIDEFGKQWMPPTIEYTFKDGNLLCRSCWTKI